MNFSRWEYVSEVDRFWAKVDKREEHECWPWLATTDKYKYGMFSIVKREGRSSHMIRSHRYSLELKLGRYLRPEEESCHKCDNNICCNPKHLFLGSHDDNMKDMANKGRTAGEKHSRAKITDSEVDEAKAMKMAGIKIKDIADHFNMSESQMSRITRGLRKRSPS